MTSLPERIRSFLTPVAAEPPPSRGPKCSYCGGTSFFEGPSGGLSTNVLCANDDCRHWFNWTPVMETLDDLKRVEPSDAEKKAAAAKREAEGPSMNLGLPRMIVPIETIYQEGRELRRTGKPARDCLQEGAYGNYGAAHSNMIRMAGWLDGVQ